MHNQPPHIPGASSLEALRAAGLLSRNAEPVFDRLTALAHRLVHTPLAMVSLVDGDRQLFKSFVGLAEPWSSRREVALSRSFCEHTLAAREVFVVEDAREHPALRGHPAIEEFGAVSYAGVPLVTATGDALGTFCVIDSRPRRWTEDEVAIVCELARSALTEIELRTVLRRTERGRAEEISAERRRAIAQLALGLRHEINNALAGLILTTEVAERLGGDEGSESDALALIRIQAERVAGVIRRLEDIDELGVVPYLGDTTMLDVAPDRPPREP